MMYEDEDDEEYEPPVTVARVQVGLLAVAKELKAELDMLAARADTSSPEGLHLILQGKSEGGPWQTVASVPSAILPDPCRPPIAETVLALMRNPEYIVFGSSNSRVINDHDNAEREFQSMSMEERSKFKEETLSNVGGISRSSSSRSQNGEIV